MIDVLKRACVGAFALSSAVLTVTGAPSEAATGVVTRCGIPQPCALYKNFTGWGFQGITAGASGFHAGVQGADVATDHGSNDGILGSTINGGYGVEGTSGDDASGGVMGLGTTGAGVIGQSATGFGIVGRSTSAIGIFGSSLSQVGVEGSSKTDPGTAGYSNSSAGVFGESVQGFGVEGISSANDAGHFASSGTGTGVAAFSGTGYALYAVTGGSIGAYVLATNGNGTDVSGSNIGLIGRSNAYPLVLTNSSSNDLFYVDGSGNVFSHGTYRTFAKTRAGEITTAYVTRATASNVEDVGSAQLVNGSALVRFDPAFAASIDLQTTYHVFLTPGGDTRGLFIASKAPSGFVVRETQGGRGTLTFDYRIVARAVGHAGDHMAFVDARTGGEPSAPRPAYHPSAVPAIVRAPLVLKTRAGRPAI